MLEHVDRVQIAVTDRAAAAQTFADIFDADTTVIPICIEENS